MRSMSILETARAGAPHMADSRPGSPRDAGAPEAVNPQNYPMMTRSETPRPHEEHCEGCTQPVSDVGSLASVRVTFTTGVTVILRWCEDCERIATLGAADPGGSYGAAALPDQIRRVERVTMATYLQPSVLPSAMHDDDVLREYASDQGRAVEEYNFSRPYGVR